MPRCAFILGHKKRPLKLFLVVIWASAIACDQTNTCIELKESGISYFNGFFQNLSYSCGICELSSVFQVTSKLRVSHDGQVQSY